LPHRRRFTPEVLGTYASTGLVTMLLEVLFIKAGFYFFENVTAVDFLDVLAYCGYLFVQYDLSSFSLSLSSQSRDILLYLCRIL
jgi:NADH:ubiquinone oxidoreductase subunit 6 (subunit J)